MSTNKGKKAGNLLTGTAPVKEKKRFSLD